MKLIPFRRKRRVLLIILADAGILHTSPICLIGIIPPAQNSISYRRVQGERFEQSNNGRMDSNETQMLDEN